MRTFIIILCLWAYQLNAQVSNFLIKELKLNSSCAECVDSSNRLSPLAYSIESLDIKISTSDSPQNIDFSLFTNLERLNVKGDINGSITNWPAKLKMLTILSTGIKVAAIPPLPEGLRYLQIEGKVYDFLTLVQLPPSLEVLIVIGEINTAHFPPTFPPLLKVLTLRKQTNLHETQILQKLPNGLKVLRLDSSRLVTLPAKLPDSLQYLHLKYNLLTQLPTLPQSLKVLDIEANAFQYLSVDAPKLVKLRCDNNRLDSLRINSDSLKYLSCVDNRLKQIVLPHSYALRELYCQNNQLVSLADLHSDSLQMLNCSNNQLITLPKMGEKLHYLDYSNNKIRNSPVFPPTIQQLISQTESEIMEENKPFYYRKGKISLTTRRHYHRYRLQLATLRSQQFQCERLLQINPNDTEAARQLSLLQQKEKKLQRKYKHARQTFKEGKISTY